VTGRAQKALWTGALAVAAVGYLAPLLFLVAGAFKPDARVLAEAAGWRAVVPVGASLHNFADVFARVPFERYLMNSLWIAAWVVAGGLAVNGLAGYALARLPFPGRRLVLGAVLALLVVPFEAIAVPLFYQMAWLGLRDTYTVQALPFVANAFSVYLFYSFFLNVPRELEEAARVDGAGPLATYLRVVVPGARPVFATVAVLTFLTQWGSFLWPLMVTVGERVRPLPVGLAAFHTLPPRMWGDIFAFCLMTAAPVLALFLLFQRWFVKGAVDSGIKG
jgi:multiple sugar transport system permease protein